MFVCVLVCVRARMYAHRCVCVRARVCACACVCARACVCVCMCVLVLAYHLCDKTVRQIIIEVMHVEHVQFYMF